MEASPPYQYDEFRQIGTDYADPAQAEIYDATHADFRDVVAECAHIVDTIALRPGQRVIDFGCGTGHFAVYAARLGAQVFAVDVSEAMLAQARRRAEEAGVGVTFAHAGFLTYAHGGPPADAIVSALVLHHLPDFWKGVALARLHAMLKPGGHFFLQDVVLPDDNALGVIADFIEKQAAAGGDFLREDAETHFREEYSTCGWVMRGLLERAGFRIRAEEWKAGVFARYHTERTG